METIGKLLGDFAHTHPVITAVLFAIVAVAVVLVNGIRMTWPVFTEMPKPARFVLGMLDPFAANFWNLARKADPDVSGPLGKTEGEPGGER